MGKKKFASDQGTMRGLSARWLALVTTFFVVAVTLAPPLQRYFSQESQIHNLQSQVNDSQKQLAAAQKELAELNDPKFIESQARSRLHFVFPGERQYIVTGLPSQNSTPPPPAIDLTNPALQNLPWYSKLISSVVSASTASGN